MNFIGRMEGGEIQVELKYCERCGGLWLRPQGADGVYCTGCRASLAAMPNPGPAPTGRARRRRSRVRRVDAQKEHPGWIENLQGVAATEVHV
jgi:hypothetical protein